MTTSTRLVRRGHRGMMTCMALVSVGALLVACGDDDDSTTPTGGGATTTSVDATDVTNTAGPPPTDSTNTTQQPPADGPLARFPALNARSAGAATGEPIHIPMINVERGPLNVEQYSQAAQAAVAFINETGGVGGRPIELSVCQTDLSPESAQACNTEVASDDPDVVLLGLSLNPQALYDQLAPLGVTVVHTLPALEADFTNPGVIAYSAVGFGYAVGVARHAVDSLDVSRFTAYSSDSPLATSPIETYVVPILKAAGVEFSLVTESASSADYLPSAAQVVASNPDAVYAAFSSVGCSNSITSLASQGYTGALYTISNCMSDQQIDTLGSAAEGVYYVAQRPDYRLEPSLLPDVLRPEMELFVEQTTTRFPQIVLDDGSLTAFASIINLAEALQHLVDDGGEIDRESVAAALRGTGANFLGEGDYDCRGDLISTAPSACVSVFYMHRWVDGVPTLVGTTDIADG